VNTSGVNAEGGFAVCDGIRWHLQPHAARGAEAVPFRALVIIYRCLSVGQKGGPSSGGGIEITDSERSYSLIVLGWLRRRSR
jgi:hypothetical protein